MVSHVVGPAQADALTIGRRPSSASVTAAALPAAGDARREGCGGTRRGCCSHAGGGAGVENVRRALHSINESPYIQAKKSPRRGAMLGAVDDVSSGRRTFASIPATLGP